MVQIDLNKLFEKNLKLTKQKIKASVSRDFLIVQAHSMVEDINKASSILASRLRAWFEIYCPEFSHSIKSHSRFVELILAKSRKDLLKEIGLKEQDCMGADLEKKDVAIILDSTRSLGDLYSKKEVIESYIKDVMADVCPNLLAVAGPSIGAKLLSLAGSLKRLSEFPSSTVQVLGAEKALFRHISGKGKSPKHGILVQHPLMERHPDKDKGKIARALADKISIAVKVDFFKGEFVGDKLKEGLEKRFRK